MSMYTVHVRGDARTASPAFVREAFNRPAFLLAPFWCLYRRSWLGLFAWAAGVALIFGLGRYLAVAEPAQSVALIALNGLFGLEAPTLHRRSLARRGFDLAAIVSAENLREAELAFAIQQEAHATAGVSPLPAPAPPPSRPRPVSASDGYGLAPLGGNS